MSTIALRRFCRTCVKTSMTGIVPGNPRLVTIVTGNLIACGQHLRLKGSFLFRSGLTNFGLKVFAAVAPRVCQVWFVRPPSRHQRFPLGEAAWH